MPHRAPLLALLLCTALGAQAVEAPSALDTTPPARPLPPILPPPDPAAADAALDDAALAAPAPPPPPIDLDYRPAGSPPAR